MSITRQILIIALLSLGAVSCHAQTSQRTIITSGSGLVSVSANMAELRLQLQAVDRNSAVAKQDVDSRVNDFIRALKRIGIDKTDVIAPTLRLSPNYEYINQKQRFTGFRATRSVTVTLSDLEQLNELMDTALDSGIDQIGQLQLKVRDEQQYQLQAREQAIEDSKQKAQALAQAYGAKLGPIVQVRYQAAATNSPVPCGRPEAMMSRSASSDMGQYIQDSIQFRDLVEVIFELQ
jgi:uncharacterized protein YggE